MLRRVNPLPSNRLPFTALSRVFASTSVAQSTDSRRSRRAGSIGRLAALAAAFCLCAAGAWGATCTVNSTADTNTGAGTAGTLRYCLSNLDSGLPASTNAISFSVTGTITLTGTLPDIENGVTITGPGANQLTISGAGAFQVMTIGNSAAPDVSISGVTIANGNNSGAAGGGGIQLGQGALTVSNCAFAGNTSSHGGGAISSGGTLSVTTSTFSGNSATAATGGGAIASSGPAMVTDSTFSSNTAGGGGAMSNVNSGVLTAVNNTFAGNSAQEGGAILNETPAATLTAGNNIISGNTATSGGAGIDNTSGATANASYNVYYHNLTGGSEDDCNGCTTNTSATPATANPLALALGNYGGATQTFLPLPSSQAICAGLASAASGAGLTADQRGFALAPAYSSCASTAVDAGAVQTNYVQVQSSGDAGAGAGDCPGSSCTLRDAVDLANGNGYGDIDFASGVNSITLASTLELSAATGINIAGPAANKLTVNGGGSASNYSVVTVDAGVPALLYGLTISNGNTTNPGGGVNNAGTLTILASAISGNSVGGSNPGGGINNIGVLSLVDSTVSGNTASGDGGGIVNQENGSATIIESTIAGNTAGTGGGGLGGGIVGGNPLILIDSTVTGNALVCAGGACGPIEGGGIAIGGPASLANTIVAGNALSCSGCMALDADVAGGFTDNGGNLAGTSSSATSTINPQLAALALNGPGATVQTMIPLPGSPAICQGKFANLPTGVTADERGEPNSNSTYPGFTATAPCVDAGAVQSDYSVSFTTNPPSTVTVDQGFGAAVTLDESGAPFTAGSVNIPITLSSGTLSGVTTEATSAGVATYSGLSTTLGSDLNLAATVSLNPALTTPLSLSATSSDFSVGQAPTSVTLSASATSSTVDQPVTLTAVVSPNVTNPVSAANTVPLSGSVTFSNNGTALTCSSTTFTYSATLGTATATCVTSALTAGTDSNITAVYSGNTSYKPSPASTPAPAITVAQAATTISVTSSPASPSLNQSVTFTALVTFPSPLTVLPGGTDTVSFSDNGTTLTSCGSGNPALTATATANVYQATCQVNSLSGGNHAIIATFNQNSADSNYLTSNNNLTLNIASQSAGVAVSSSQNPSVVNQPVTYKATVSGGTTVQLTGTVTFVADSTNTLGTCNLTNWSSTTGQASCSISPVSSLTEGTHSIAANYSGDSSYGSSTINLSPVQTVNKASTTIAVVTSTTPSTVNQSVTFTATVTPAFTGTTVPSGTVKFTATPTAGSAATPCPSATVSSGVATCTTSSLTAASYTISATYSGDGNFSAPTSAGTVPQMVNQASAIVSLASSLNPSIVNSSVTFTANVTGNPSGSILLSSQGTVAFTDSVSGTTICTQTITPSVTTNTGTATCQTATLAVGAHTITASYSNDPNYAYQVGSGIFTQTVDSASASITLVSSALPSAVGQTVTFTAAFPIPSGQTPKGSVKFTDNGALIDNLSGTSICTAVSPTVSGSTATATCADPSLTVGSHAIVAIYSGDANITVANGTLTQIVNSASGSISLTASPGLSTIVNVPVTFTAKFTDSSGTAPSETVGFTDNGNPVMNMGSPICTAVAPTATPAGGTTYTASCTAPALTAGAHTIVATYKSGDPNLTLAPFSVTQQVSEGTSTTTVTSNTTPVVSNPKGVNEPVTFTANVTPSSTGQVTLTGTVQFTYAPPGGTPTIIPGCGAVSVLPVLASGAGAAMCTDAALTGPTVITATYSEPGTVGGPVNFTPSTYSSTQTVQDFTLSTIPAVTITQGFTSASDPFSAQTLSVSPVSIQGFATCTGSNPPFPSYCPANNTAAPLKLTCTVASTSGGSGAAPICKLYELGTTTPASTLAVLQTGQAEPALTLVVDATSAAAGGYTVTVGATDPTTGLTGMAHSTVFNVTVRAISAELQVASGATTNNMGSVTFEVPNGVTLSNFGCVSLTGAGITQAGGESPSKAGISCGLGTPAVSGNTVTLPVTVCTSGSATCTLTAQSLAPALPFAARRSGLLVAGLFGLPLFGLLGIFGRKRTRKTFYRLLVLLAVGVAALQSMGCGGSFHTSSTTVSGTTPPGVYYLLVQANGSDGNTYQAVLQLDVTVLGVSTQ